MYVVCAKRVLLSYGVCANVCVCAVGRMCTHASYLVGVTKKNRKKRLFSVISRFLYRKNNVKTVSARADLHVKQISCVLLSSDLRVLI